MQHFPVAHVSHTWPPPHSVSAAHAPVLTGGLLSTGFALATGLLDSAGLGTTVELAGATLSWVGVAPVGVPPVGVAATVGADAGVLAWALVASSARIPGSGGAEDDELQPQRAKSARIAGQSRFIRCLSF